MFPGLGSALVKERSSNADGMGIKSATAHGPWRVVVGPQITANQYHCATVPDGPDCQWSGGGWHRIEERNRKALEKEIV
jgi:hypothetical protein